MSSKLISSKYPFLPLSIHVRIANRKNVDLQTQALIDTGFSGDIVVPATKELKQSIPDAYATWAMADGSEVLAPIFLGSIRFPQLDEDVAEMVGVTVTVLGDQSLIGQSVLRRFTRICRKFRSWGEFQKSACREINSLWHRKSSQFEICDRSVYGRTASLPFCPAAVTREYPARSHLDPPPARGHGGYP
jgi:predicted aspartyl protease